MDELTLNGEKYISSKRAAKLTGYTKDYVGQLCREGKIIAQLVGRNWYISELSIHNHRFESEDSSPVQAPTTSKHVTKLASTQHHTLHDTIHYVHNEVNIIPLQKKEEAIAQVREINTPQNSPKEEPPQKEKSAVLSTMQNAWQEWFTTTTHEIREDVALLRKDFSKEEASNKAEYDDSEAKPKMSMGGIHASKEYDIQPVLIHKVTSTIPSYVNKHTNKAEYFDTAPRRSTSYKRNHIVNIINITLMVLALVFFVIALLNVFLSVHTNIYQLHYITGISVYTAK